jgi:hypothetical protein
MDLSLLFSSSWLLNLGSASEGPSARRLGIGGDGEGTMCVVTEFSGLTSFRFGAEGMDT